MRFVFVVGFLTGSRFAKPEVVTKVNKWREMSGNVTHRGKSCESTSLWRVFRTGVKGKPVVPRPPQHTPGAGEPTPNTLSVTDRVELLVYRFGASLAAAGAR